MWRRLRSALALGVAMCGCAWAGPGRPQNYHLTAEETVKAKAFARARNTVYWGGEAVFLAALVGMIKLRTGARLRQAAEGVTHRRWLQAWMVVPPVLLVVAAVEIPFDIYAEIVSRRFGQSIETWGEWAGDWAKAEGLVLAIGTLAAWGLYALLRASPKRWWVWAWLIAIPVEVAATVVEPVIIEPLFYDYQPLGTGHPELVADIERILHRAGIAIPPGRLYEMKASEKTNSLNAYVSGFGPSKRVVLYDTIIAKEKGPPLLTTVGHELGHYALHHIRNGLLAGFAVTLFALWVAAMALRFVAPEAQPGAWDTVPELLLVLSVILFLLTPAMNAYSRMQEHEADVYSIEVTHGVVPDPGGAAAQAFQIEGETAFADPSPSPFEVFWLYSHPPIADRLRFSLDYDPWRAGARPRFVAP